MSTSAKNLLRVNYYLKIMLSALFLALTPAVFAVQAPSQATTQAEMVDINSADAATLALVLEGVGMTKAQEIVAYRELHGKFDSIEQLLEVKGIGAATLEKNRHRLIVVRD